MPDNKNGGTKDEKPGGGGDSSSDEERPAPWRDMDRLTHGVRRDRDSDAQSDDERS